MQSEYDHIISTLDKESYNIIKQIDSYYAKLGGFIEAAMSKESAARLYGSIELCRFLKIPEQLIIHNIKELDDFMYQ